MKTQSKLLLLILSAGLSVAPLLRAQDAPNPDSDSTRAERREKAREHAKEHRERIAQELDLNDDQKAKMQEINQQEKSAIQAVRADTSLSKEDKRAKAREIHQSFAGQRDTVLTPEQKTKADQLRARHKERHEERREKRREHRQGGDGSR